MVCFADGTNQWEQQEWPWIEVETDANDEENVQIESSKDIENKNWLLNTWFESEFRLYTH